MTFSIIAAVIVAIVAGVWYSYYQSVQRLRAHDRETVRIMETDLAELERGGAAAAVIAAQRERIREFRERHKVT